MLQPVLEHIKLKGADRTDDFPAVDIFYEHLARELLVLNDFYLVGGTALALNFGHRKSDEDPLSLKEQTWESVKKIIQQNVSDYLK